MVWFLDTNIIVACLRGKSPAAMRRLQAVQASDVRVPLQVHAELLVGAAKSNNPIQAKTRVLSFLVPFVVAWPDAAVEDQYVAIRTELEALGMPISEADLGQMGTPSLCSYSDHRNLALPVQKYC